MTAAVHLPNFEIRASSLAQIMQCMGPVVLSNILPNETNPAAMEGTAAGELLRYMLEQKSLSPQVPLVAENGVRFDEDMYFYLRPHAEDILRKANGNEITCEVRVDFATPSGIPLRGQYDVSFYEPSTETLHMYDLKYGYGIVDAHENWQLIAYCIGRFLQVMKYGHYPKFYKFEIHQPRAFHPEGPIRSWTITHEELMQYYYRIEARFQQIANGDRELRTGSKCKYCRAAPVCPAFNKSVHDALETTMNDWVQDDMSNDALARQLQLAERAAELIKIRIDSLNQLGVIRVKAGQIIPGRGMKETYGHRKWKPMVTPESFKMLTGVDIRETVIMSPAKAEKAGVSEDFVDMLTERPLTNVKLVPMDLSAQAEKAFGKIPK